MQSNISIIFYIKRTKLTADGLAPIYMRVTIQGIRIDVSAKRPVDPEKWSPEAGRLKQGSGEATSINKYLDMLKMKVYDIQAHLMQKGVPVNADNMRNQIMGVDEKRHSLIKIFQDHNNQMKQLVGKEFAPGTLGRYETSLKHTLDFIKWKFNISDIDIRSVNHSFVTEFEFYLRSVRNCNNNSAVKYIKNFGKIIRICMANGWVDKNPFANYKSKIKIVDRIFLTEIEVHTIFNKVILNVRLSQIRDVFIFCCYTGLAYADAKNLRQFHIVLGIDGDKKIVINRQKTGSRSVIPLLPIPEDTLEKYANHAQCLNSGKLLPVLSNQKVNEYLKELAAICGIEKEITFHTARHTFATMMLNNGVPIESLQAMLGHKDLKDTQHYAKLLDYKIVHDMQAIKEKFKAKTVEQEKTGS